MGKTALGIVQKYAPQVRHISDAKKPLSVVVKTADCKGARSKKADGWAMANACKREHDGAIISMAYAYIIDGDKAVRYRVPASVSREIVSFDRSHIFAPGNYTLNAPKSHDILGYRMGGDGNSGKKKAKVTRKQVHHRTTGIRSL